jgi:hypothetical protein
MDRGARGGTLTPVFLLARVRDETAGAGNAILMKNVSTGSNRDSDPALPRGWVPMSAATHTGMRSGKRRCRSGRHAPHFGNPRDYPFGLFSLKMFITRQSLLVVLGSFWY